PASPVALPSLTLDQALALAAERSYALSAARRQAEAADGSVLQAGMLRNPELSLSLEDTRRATRTTTATLAIPLELGGKRAARVGAAALERELAQAELGQAQAELRAAVIEAYFGALVAQQRLALANDSAVLATRGAQATARRVAAGKVSPVDETRALVDQANAQLEAAEAAAGLEAARHALAMLWGDVQPGFGELAGEVEAVPARPPLAELASELEASPALRSSRLQAEHSRALAGVERSRQSPDLTLSVGAKRDNELGRTQAVIGIAVPLPFFDRNQGAVLQAQKRADQAGDTHQAARQRLLQELQQAISQLALARNTALALKSTVLPAAQQALEAAGKGFEAGKFGFLDVIDGQRTLIHARASYLGALATSHQAASAIDRLLGR
ncbi:MAG TPA: TolC family protein, partial [Ideonella sp.]|nr:TolC family protein [Ideonella sp.]